MSQNARNVNPGKRGQSKIIIKIVDGDGNEIFNWRPGSGNVALGLRKGCEIAGAKLGLERELKKQGIVLKEREENSFDKLAEVPN